jgi:DNA-binding NtrC family response regulator
MEGVLREALRDIGKALDRVREAESAAVAPGARRVANGGTLKSQVDAFERAILVDVLGAHGGNRTRAAGELGMTREGLHKIIKRHGIE